MEYGQCFWRPSLVGEEGDHEERAQEARDSWVPRILALPKREMMGRIMYLDSSIIVTTMVHEEGGDLSASFGPDLTRPKVFLFSFHPSKEVRSGIAFVLSFT